MHKYLLLALCLLAGLASALAELAFEPVKTIDDVSVTESSSKSWGDRISDSITGFCFGLFLFILAFPCLTFAEGSAVHREKSLNYAQELLDKQKKIGNGSDAEKQSLLEDRVTNNGELRHESGYVTADDVKLTDSVFGITVEHKLVLNRKVEMYQYYEKSSSQTKKDNFGGGEKTETKYTLDKGWFSTRKTLEHISGYENPELPFLPERLEAQGIRLTEGITQDEVSKNPISTLLSTSQKSRLDVSERIPFTKDAYTKFPSSCNNKLEHHFRLKHGHDTVRDLVQVEANGDLILHKKKNDEGWGGHEVGDLRISLKAATQDYYSLLASVDVKTQTFQAYEITKFGKYHLPFLCGGCCPGPIGWVMQLLEGCASSSNEIDLFERGIVTDKVLITHALKSNAFYLTIMRFITWLMFIGGLMLMLEPVAVLVDVIGFVGSIVRVGTFFASFVVGTVCWLLTAAVAWIMYHPVKGGIMLAVAGGIIYGAHYYASTLHH